MNAVSLIVVFSVCWWMVFFIVLPIGVVVEKKPPKGHASSAPKQPRISLKIGITTLVATIITAIYFFSLHYGAFDIINLRSQQIENNRENRVSTTQDILDFWFSDDVRPKWFAKDSAFDKEIKERFLTTYKQAKQDQETLFGDSPEGVLALVIVLDQFPRNIFRDTKQAYATDKLALKHAELAVKKKYDKKLSDEQRRFLYMPFMHSEDLKDQRSSVALFGTISDQGGRDYALKHKETIVRFTRFPHRNEMLGRKSTEQELTFLEGPNSSF